MTPFVDRPKPLPASRRSTSKSPRRAGARPRTHFRPRLDPLEGRTLLSTWTVMNNNDSGPGSLRYDIGQAAPGDTIDFAASLDGQTIALELRADLARREPHHRRAGGRRADRQRRRDARRVRRPLRRDGDDRQPDDREWLGGAGGRR